MDAEEFDSIFPLKLPFFVDELPFLFLAQGSTVLVEHFLVLFGGLWRYALIYQLLDFIIHKQGTSRLLFLSRLHC